MNGYRILSQTDGRSYPGGQNTRETKAVLCKSEKITECKHNFPIGYFCISNKHDEKTRVRHKFTKYTILITVLMKVDQGPISLIVILS